MMYRHLLKDASGAIILLLLIQLLLAIKLGVFSGLLGDPDAYMWLNRVLQLHETGNWFDHVIHRVDPPVGYEQHWTRPFDVVLFSGAWLGSYVSDFGTSLHVWGVLIGPIIEILALLSLLWMVSPLLEKNKNEILAILFVTQMGIAASFVAGRADHQVLILLFFIISLGYGIRMLTSSFSRSLCYRAGLVSALAIWISIESILFTLITFLVLGLAWLRGERDVARKLIHYSLSLLLLLILFRAIEYGPDHLAEPASDQISIVYLALFGLIAIFWACAYSIENIFNRSGGPYTRFGIALLYVAMMGGILEMYFPGFFTSPMQGNSDELFRRTHLPRVTELQPVISLTAWSSGDWIQQLSHFSKWLGILVPGIPVLIYLTWKSTGKKRKAWIYISICLLVYVPLSINELRWVPYTAILILPAYVWLISTIMQTVASKGPASSGSVLRILVLVASAVIFFVPDVLLSKDKAGTGIKECPLKPVSAYLDSPDHSGARSAKLLAFTDFGPELLYRTKHSVYSIPSHRFHQGFIDNYLIMSAQDDNEALRIIQAREVDLILICPGGHENYFYRSNDDDDGVIFHQRLSQGQAPDWLEEVPLPAELARTFRLFSVSDAENP